MEKLQQMKRELAKKERKLQKLKRSAGGSSSGNCVASPRALRQDSPRSTSQSAHENTLPREYPPAGETAEISHDEKTSAELIGCGNTTSCCPSSAEKRQKLMFKAISHLFSDSSTDTAESNNCSQTLQPTDDSPAKRTWRQHYKMMAPRRTRSCTAVHRVIGWLIAEAQMRPSECFSISDDIQFQALVVQRLETSKAASKEVGLGLSRSAGNCELQTESENQQTVLVSEAAAKSGEPVIGKHPAVKSEGEMQRNCAVQEVQESWSQRKLLVLEHPLRFYRSLKVSQTVLEMHLGLTCGYFLISQYQEMGHALGC